ncbi:hypothetical protein BT93_B0919 [Corymbia citriodora subsp. variegata]|nr:hypothetical protein BT93_B0919 [Corymbia citriodora subsp. variegata]
MGYELDYIDPVEVDSELVAYFPDDALAGVDPLWPECLVGYFVGKKLPFKMVETALKHAWGSKLAEVKADDKGFFFFRIPNANFRRVLLKKGPLTVARVPLVLQQWEPLMELKKHDHSKIPVWIRLRDIPFVLWSKRGISGIASLIGKPLYVDQNTEQMRNLAFARVCVEIKATDVRRESVKVVMKGITREVSIEYKWRPTSCAKCGVFGHNCNPQVSRKPSELGAPAGDQTVHVNSGGDNLAMPEHREGDGRKTTDQIAAASKAKAPINTDINQSHSQEERVNNIDDWQIQPAARRALRRQAKKNLQRFSSAPPKKLAASPSSLANLATKDKEEHCFDEAVRQIVSGCHTDMEPSPANSTSEEDIDESEGSSYEDDSPEEIKSKNSSPANKQQEASGEDPMILSHVSESQTNIRQPQCSPPRDVSPPPQRMSRRRASKRSCLGLLETKVRQDLFVPISSAILPGWTWVANYNSSPRGRIWVGWDPSTIQFSCDYISSQIIHGQVTNIGSGTRLFFAAIYGDHTFTLRRPLWEDLKRISLLVASDPWILGGDFNAIRDASDRQGSPNIWHPSFDELNDCIFQAELDDLRYVGFRFTWSSYSGIHRKQRKIDRVLVNNQWSLQFSYSEAIFLPPSISDHSPAVVHVLQPVSRRKPFKFFNFWMAHPQFEPTLAQVWDYSI